MVSVEAAMAGGERADQRLDAAALQLGLIPSMPSTVGPRQSASCSGRRVRHCTRLSACIGIGW